MSLFTVPIKIEKHIAKRGLQIVTSADKNAPGSIFSSDVFGVTDEERFQSSACIPLNTYVMFGLALDKIKIIDRTVYDCATTKGKFVLTKERILKRVPEDYEKQDPSEIIGFGPQFLYDIWNMMDKSKYAKTDGKISNVLMSNAILSYKREDLFTSFQYVSSIAFREEQQDSSLVVNETNQILTDIVRFSNLIKNNPTLDNDILRVYLQNKVYELFQHNSKLFGSHGEMNDKLLSRPVDSSCRAVLLSATFPESKLGISRFRTDTIGVPIYHLNKTYVLTVKKYFANLLDILFDNGCFDPDVSRDRLAVYDAEFIDESISKFEDNYVKVKNFPAIKSDGTFGDLMVDIEVDGEIVTKPLTWIEFFYIILVPLIDIENNRFGAVTRYPVDREKSCQMLRPIVLTLTDKYLKTVSMLGFNDIKYFPYITEDIKTKHHTKIFEQGFRVIGGVAVACNGDHDGDQVSFKPINSVEAVEDCKNYHDTLSSEFSSTGEFSRKVGKCSDQTLYTFTREPKPKDKSKRIEPDHEFVQYLMSLDENGEMDINILYKWTTVYGDLTKPKVSLYDKTVIKRFGKPIETTIGQLIVNKVIFSRMWDNKNFEYRNVVTIKVFGRIMKECHQMVLEEKLTVADLKYCINMYNEFTLRLSTLYNSSLTQEMLNPDDTFRDYKEKVFKEYDKEINVDGNIDKLNEATNKVIDFAKKYYADNDMVELYESGGKSKWDGDFATMQIAMGPMVTLVGDKPKIITRSLSEGMPFSMDPDLANVAFRGAIDRGGETALAGELYKNILTSMQSVKGFRGDCGSKKGETITCDDRTLLLNRYVLNKDGSVTKITTDNVNKYLDKPITLRSPMYCKVKNGNICSTCAGDTQFDSIKADEVNIGLHLTDTASAVLNLFLQATHDSVMKTYKINNFNDYIYPKASKPIFYHKVDPIDNTEKIYTNYDIEWRIPKSAITPIDTRYSVLAHGSVIAFTGNDKSDNLDHAVVLGTEISTNPFEIIKPDTGDNDDTKHFVFKYKKDDCVINNSQTFRKTHTVYKMLKLYLRGNVSNLIPIEAHLQTLQNCFKTNKTLSENDYAVSVILATLARNAKNVFKTYREDSTGDYIFIGTDDLVTISNTFNGIMGPDGRRSLFVACSRSFEEQTKNPSPIETAFQS